MLISANTLFIKKRNLNGSGVIRGVSLRAGIPRSSVVRIFERESSVFAGQYITNDDGVYEFKGLKNIPYIVAAIDGSSEFNAVIQDNVVPK